MGFIQNDKTVIQRSAAHIGKGRHLNGAALLVLLEGFRTQHIIQRIVKRAKVGGNLILQISRQKAQALPCLNSGAGQNDPIHRSLTKSGNRCRHSQIGLARTGRANANGDRIGLDRPHIALLTNGFGFDGLSLGSDADHVLCHLGDLLIISLIDQGDQVSDTLLIDYFPFGGQRQKPLDCTNRFVDHFLVAGHPQIGAAIDNLHVQSLLDTLDILVKGSKNRNQVLYTIRINDSLRLFCHLSLQSVLVSLYRLILCRHSFP